MIDLHNPEEIKKLDPKDVYGSTELFSTQCRQIWEDVKNTSFDQSLKQKDNIIICGMGGSAYGGYVAQVLYKNELKVSLISNNDYDLPGFANEKSLVFLSTYSGTTEESLSCGRQALEKQISITALTNGGPLAEFLKEKNIQGVVFDPKNNPSGQPRLGTGYMVLGCIAILNKLGYLNLSDEEVLQAIDEVDKHADARKSEAKRLANEFLDTFPVIFSSQFLNGNAHILRNQFNETAKSFSAFEDIPELNHHLMEGFKYPEGNKMKALFLESNLYTEVHKKRLTLTRDVVEKNGYQTATYKPMDTTKLSQMLDTLSFGGYITLYLALLHGQDPSLIPWVDYFKEELKK